MDVQDVRRSVLHADQHFEVNGPNVGLVGWHAAEVCHDHHSGTPPALDYALAPWGSDPLKMSGIHCCWSGYVEEILIQSLGGKVLAVLVV